MVAAVDLNADLAEGASLTPSDRAVLDVVTSASLACGFHAGSPAVMQAAAGACVERGVAVGAHVSFRDRDGFGRRVLDVPPRVVTADILEQVAGLAAAVTPEGATIAYLKPHGALYNQMGIDPALAAAVVEATRATGVGTLVGQMPSAIVVPAQEAGLTVIPEAFPDRGYRGDGRLVARGEPGALVEDPAQVAERALSLVVRGGIESIDGHWAAVEVATVCVHGDSPGAAGTARAVRDALESAGVTVRAFSGVSGVTPPARRPGGRRRDGACRPR